MAGIECPLCSNVDLVQKVTAIAEGETHHTSGYSATTNTSSISGKQDYYTQQDRYAGRGDLSGTIQSQSSTNISATQQSRLAQKLSPPAKPSSPTEPTFETSLLSGFPEGIGIGIGFVAWILLSSLLFAIFPGVDNSSVTGILMVCVGGPILTGLVLGIIAALIEFTWNRIKFPAEKRQEMTATYQSKLQKYEQVAYPRWQEAMDRWNSMYYCRRCDVVYVPGDDVKPQSPDKTLDLCYHGVQIT